MAVTAGPNDSPQQCERCGTTTLHRPDAEGKLHCLKCLTEQLAAPAKIEPAAIPVAPGGAKREEVVVRTPLGEHVRNGLVAGVLAVICIIIWAHACGAMNGG